MSVLECQSDETKWIVWANDLHRQYQLIFVDSLDSLLSPDQFKSPLNIKNSAHVIPEIAKMCHEDRHIMLRNVFIAVNILRKHQASSHMTFYEKNSINRLKDVL